MTKKRKSSSRFVVLVGVIANAVLLFALPHSSMAIASSIYSNYSTYSDLTPILSIVLDE